MSMYWRSTLTAALIALGAQGVAAQPVNGCPAGQAMQSSSPSGKQFTCVPVVHPNALQAEITARQEADASIVARLDALAETDIVGRWAMTGGTMCLQSTNGFNASLSPQSPTNVSQLHGTVSAVRTFRADGTGSSTGVTQTLSMPQQSFGLPPSTNTGGASLADLNANFTWSIDAEGRLVIDDDNLIPQNFVLPTARVGFTVTIENVPSFVGHISKDKKTIVMTHATVALETSVLRDPSNTVIARTPRFCARDRVLTRLPD